MTICKDYNYQVFPHFNIHEFYSKSPDAPQCHELSDITMQAVNYIREYYGVPVVITSTYRTRYHELVLLGKKTTGQHFEGNAIDFKILDKAAMEDYQRQVASASGEVFTHLRQMGIAGFGLYDNFNHIDSRPEGGSHIDAFGSYAYWDNRKKNIRTLRNF
jgi:hypothetical protein